MEIRGRGIHEARVAFYIIISIHLILIAAIAVDQVVIHGHVARRDVGGNGDLKGQVLAGDVVADDHVLRLGVVGDDAAAPVHAVLVERVVDDDDAVHRPALGAATRDLDAVSVVVVGDVVFQADVGEQSAHLGGHGETGALCRTEDDVAGDGDSVGGLVPGVHVNTDGTRAADQVAGDPAVGGAVLGVNALLLAVQHRVVAHLEAATSGHGDAFLAPAEPGLFDHVAGDEDLLAAPHADPR